MNKLKYIRVQEQDNSYSADIPIGADAQNIDMKNNNTLQDTIGNLDVSTDDNITEQLASLHQGINSLNSDKLNKSDVNNYVPPVVTNWLNNNVNPVGSAVTIDKSLSIEGSAADAKAVGDMKNAVSITTATDFDEIEPLNKPYALFNTTYQNAPPVQNVVGILYVNEDASNHFIWQTFIHYYSGYVYTRFKRGTAGTWDPWSTNSPLHINDNINFNDLISTATYMTNSSGTNYSNCPVNSDQAGILNVYADKDSQLILQIYTQISSGKTFTRVKVISGWRDWNLYEGNHFIPPISLAGDTSIDINDLQQPGMYTTANGNRNNPNFPPVSGTNSVGMFIVSIEPNTGIIYQTYIDSYTTLVYTRIKISSGWRSWVQAADPWKQSISAFQDMNDITTNGIYTSLTGQNIANFPPATSQVGTLIVTSDTGTGIIYHAFIESYTGKIYTRIKRAAGWDLWSYHQNEISILFVGNSLTQDGIAYLPYLLKNYYPEVNFHFYMWYNGGRTLADQYNIFVNNTKADMFSVANNVSYWMTYQGGGGKTMSEVLSTYKFDIVCMQEYFNYKESYQESDLADWNNCKNYIASHYTGGNPLEFVSLFHAPLRSDAEAVFNRTVSGNNLILKKTISDDMIPIGIAIYRALSTELDSLGDQGHLTPDGTHAQEGLPCLLQTYVAASWLLDKLGIAKSIYNCPLRMTTAIYNTINVPGPNLGNGVITGTDAQNLLAQEIAIKAYKEGKHYVNNNMFEL